MSKNPRLDHSHRTDAGSPSIGTRKATTPRHTHPTEASATANLFSDDDTASTAARRRSRHDEDAALLDAIRRRLGLSEPLTFQLMRLPLDRLVVRDRDQEVLRRGRGIAVSFKLVGQLTPLGVVPLDPDDAPDEREGCYEVWFGRARREAARILRYEEDLADWGQLWCHVYDLPADGRVVRRMRAAMKFSENACRSAAWVEELRQAVELLEVPMTDAEFWTMLGLNPGTAKALLTMARLPSPILTQAFDGTIRGKGLLRRISRLTRDQIKALARRAEAGESITETLVSQALRGQITASLSTPALQAALSQDWEVADDVDGITGRPGPPLSSAPAAAPHDTPNSMSVLPVPPTAVPDAGPSRVSDVSPPISMALPRLLAAVRTALPELARDPQYVQTYLLADALRHELESVVRPLQQTPRQTTPE